VDERSILHRHLNLTGAGRITPSWRTLICGTATAQMNWQAERSSGRINAEMLAGYATCQERGIGRRHCRKDGGSAVLRIA
jgi:hypothetical protein